MTSRQALSGAAVPLGWTVDSAMVRGAEADAKNSNKDGAPPPGPLDLLSFPGVDQWAPRDQGDRATCTAFAVAAAEEIWYARQRQSAVEALSPEYLYGKMWLKSYAEVGIDYVNGDRAAALKAAGATYLAQAKVALEEHGICREDLAAYRLNAPATHRAASFSPEAEQDAQSRRVPTDVLTHAIVRLTDDGTAVGQNQTWDPALGSKTVSEIFIDALAGGAPIVAAFALLNRHGANAWRGHQARLCGLVRYPSDDRMDGLAAVDGHAVCIVGFVPSPDDTAIDGGLFVFRNSHGVREFGLEAGRGSWRCGSEPRFPGYGVISVADVDRYCWEYLFRDPGS